MEVTVKQPKIEVIKNSPYAIFTNEETKKHQIIVGGQAAHPRMFKYKWAAKIRAMFPSLNMTIIAAVVISKAEMEKEL